ncbi:MAG: class F sortase [Minisyncoccia bacterium]
MKPRLSLKWALLTIGTLVLIVVLNTTVFARANKKTVQVASVITSVEATTTTTTIATTEISKPTKVVLPRLIIQKIKVNAYIEQMGLTKAGAMDSPVGPTNAGWYKFGPKPGSIGSAVIDGHFGWKDNIPAVFDNLSKLKVGDKIQVIDESNKTITFIVTKTKVLANNADATEVFSSTDGKAHLNLITCSGSWNITTKNRPSRLVVFTDKAV